MKDTIKVDKKQVKMVAHRGLSSIELENTNSAFIAAGNRSHFGIETDVRRTADGKYILLHDDNTERVGIDTLIPEKTTFETLRALRLRDKDGVRSRADLHLCSLTEYIDTCRRYGKHCVLELKGAYTPEWLTEIIGIIRDMEWLENVTFISFSLDNLIKLRAILPEQKIQWLTCEYNEKILETLKAYSLGLDIYFGGLHKEDVAQMHESGIDVNCWTVDKKEDAERLIEWGVDFITSNTLE